MSDGPSIEEVLNAFSQAFSDGSRPDFQEYYDRVPGEHQGELAGCLIEEDLRQRLSRGEQPWLDDFLSFEGLWDHHSSILRSVNQLLFGYDIDLAESLGFRRFGPFEAKQLIGIGGFATAFLAVSSDQPAREVLIKVAHRKPPQAAMRLDNECRVVQKVQELHISGFPVLIDSRLDDPRRPYLVFDFVEGITLSNWLDTNPSYPQRLVVCSQLAELVVHLHRKEIVHGDLSGQNVLVSDVHGRLKVHLLDFGESSTRYHHCSLIPAWTERYTAPELLVGLSGRTNTRSDMWSLGILLHECLAGLPPFEPPRPFNVNAWAAQLAQGPRTDVPDAFGPMVRMQIRRCLTADPLERTLTIDQILQAIAAAKEAPDIQAGARAESLLNTYYERLMARFGHVILPIPDEMGDVRSAPINDIYVDLPLEVTREVAEEFPVAGWSHMENLRRAPTIRDRAEIATLRDRLNRHRSAVIIGNPGSGKSTILGWHIWYSALQQLARRSAPSALSVHITNGDAVLRQIVPLVLICRDLKLPLSTNIEDWFVQQLRKFGFSPSDCEALAAYFFALLTHGKATLFVDGLDEITDAHERRHFCQNLAEYSQTSRCFVIATSRPVGFNMVRDVFGLFDLIEVAPLPSPLQKEFATKLLALHSQSMESFGDRLEHRMTSQLVQNALMLTLLVQLSVIDPALSTRRVDVFNRLLRVLLDRQRVSPRRKPLTWNEVLPHLESLAFAMQANWTRELSETEITRIFEGVRNAEQDDVPELRRRPPQSLLNSLVNHIGLLHVIGTRKDGRGLERRRIKFFHNSLQEFFAGLALIHGRGCHGESIPDRIRQFLIPSSEVVIKQMPIGNLAQGNRVEPVIADEWQEVISFAIASLTEEHDVAADDIISLLLPTVNTLPDVARASVVFALHIIADEPTVTTATASRIFSAVADIVRREDGYNFDENTLLDRAIAATRESRFGADFDAALIAKFISAKGDAKYLIGRVWTPRTKLSEYDDPDATMRLLLDGLYASNEQQQIYCALQLLGLFFSAFEGDNTPLSYLQHELYDLAVETLLDRAESATVSARYAILWALSWLLGSRIDHKTSVRWLNSSEEERLLLFLDRTESDDPVQATLALLVTCVEGHKQSFSDLDIIMELANVADGNRPQQQISRPHPCSRKALAERLAVQLRVSQSVLTKQSIATALGRLGYFCPLMAEPLFARMCDDLAVNSERDEAVRYLTQVHSDDVRIRLAELASGVDDSYGVSERAMFVIIAQGDAAFLRLLVTDSDPSRHYRQEYAYGLAGIADPIGRRYLQEIVNHSNEQIGRIATKALDKARIWDLL